MSSYPSSIDTYTLGEHVSGLCGALIEAFALEGRIHLQMEQGPTLLPKSVDRSDLRDLVRKIQYRIAATIERDGKKYIVFGHTHPVMREYVMIGSSQARHRFHFEHVRSLMSSEQAIGVPGSSVLMELDGRIVAPAIRLP